MNHEHFAVEQALIEKLQESEFRWHVRIIVATEGGMRVRHEECQINAPDQFSAVAIAMITKLDHVTATRWEGLHILVDAMPNSDARPTPLTEEQIIGPTKKKKPRH